MAKIWSDSDKALLIEKVKLGWQRKELAGYFGVTENSIEIKVSRLGYKILRENRDWTADEEESFRVDWKDPSFSMYMLMKKYARNENGLKIKAQRMKLGPRNEYREHLSITDIIEEMQVSRDRVSAWIKLGLKTSKNKAGKGKYSIKANDLLTFLEKNQSKFNASKISEYLFADEPDWLIEKRKRDINPETCEYREYETWTTMQIKRVKDLVKLGYDIEKIAKTLKKTEYGVRRIINEHDIDYKDERYYSEEEIDILYKYHDKVTVEQLAIMLKNKRTIKGICYKCEQLGLRYHLVESTIKGIK